MEPDVLSTDNENEGLNVNDQALKDVSSFAPAVLNSGMLRARQAPPLHLADKVVPLALPVTEQAGIEGAAPAPAALRDWSSALELVQEASEAIRIGEERANQLEEHLAQVLQEAGDEIKRLNAVIASGERKLAETEERVGLAETRAAEAELWLAKLHDTVVASFTPMLKKGSDPAASDDREETAVPD